jgi:hypothetical protein
LQAYYRRNVEAGVTTHVKLEVVVFFWRESYFSIGAEAAAVCGQGILRYLEFIGSLLLRTGGSVRREVLSCAAAVVLRWASNRELRAIDKIKPGG